MLTACCNPSSVQLHLELGEDFLLEMLDNFGVSGWNLWIESMSVSGYMPLCWGEHDTVPPCWYWINLTDADFFRLNLNRINLSLAYCTNCCFDESNLTGARLSFVSGCYFRGADLRLTDFQNGDISNCDFSDANVDYIKLEGATYDALRPPIGLPDELLRVCKAEHREKTTRKGAKRGSCGDRR